MIRNDLKVGDKFTDGNRTFEVLNVVSEGVYISKVLDTKITEGNVINQPKVEKKEEITEKPVKTYTKTEINRTPNDKLEEICKELGLECGTGTSMKKAIIEKLGL